MAVVRKVLGALVLLLLFAAPAHGAAWPSAGNPFLLRGAAPTDLADAHAAPDQGDVAVIDATRCNATRHASCADAVVATIPGAGDTGVVVDAATGTLYVADFENGTVSAVDTATCNARATTGCAAARATADVGATPLGLALDPDMHTLYVGHIDAFLSAIDTATCNGHTSGGCGAAALRIRAGGGPAFPTVDRATQTLYAPENGD